MYKLFILFILVLLFANSCLAQNNNLDKNIINEHSTNKHCKKLTHNQDSYVSGFVCFYSNKSLLETYKSYWKKNLDNENGKGLRKKIVILKNYHDVITKGSKEVTYKWNSKKKLTIELFFSGGTTTLIFQEKNNGTELTTIYDAD